MGRVPIAASMDDVKRALDAGGELVCTELVGLLKSRDKDVVERAARTLKKISEAMRKL